MTRSAGGDRLAVVLFNLGGPDRPEAIRPFLYNLFDDPAIVGLPGPVRHLLAVAVSTRREREARAIYARIGGRSPILEETWRQAHALQVALGEPGEAPPTGEVRVFVAMRYWHPMSHETAAAVAQWRPDRIVLIPLYPQFSTTTTASSLTDWHRAAKAVGLGQPTVAVCCYPTETGLAEAHALALDQAIARVGPRPYRILFSAHGLPKTVVARGDPYPWQVERTAEAVLKALGGLHDAVVCYQSRVGPLAWIGPATGDEIKRAGRDGVAVVLVPIAFVSEHSETLVELDMIGAELARKAGVTEYLRVPALGADPVFIAGLAGIVRRARGNPCSAAGHRLCPQAHRRCPMAG
ncbi:MAG: ferrochelatase [Alphaproteobacteria bacterium]